MAIFILTCFVMCVYWVNFFSQGGIFPIIHAANTLPLNGYDYITMTHTYESKVTNLGT